MGCVTSIYLSDKSPEYWQGINCKNMWSELLPREVLGDKSDPLFKALNGSTSKYLSRKSIGYMDDPPCFGVVDNNVVEALHGVVNDEHLSTIRQALDNGEYVYWDLNC